MAGSDNAAPISLEKPTAERRKTFGDGGISADVSEELLQGYRV